MIPEKKAVAGIGKVLVVVDDIILYVVVAGIIVVAIRLLVEAWTDVFDYSQHSIPHVISDLMLVLIMMELFRQVMRQIHKQAFSLNPFFYIGIIASIRAILITQMRVGLGETALGGGRYAASRQRGFGSGICLKPLRVFHLQEGQRGVGRHAERHDFFGIKEGRNRLRRLRPFMFFIGGGYRGRTDGLHVANVALSQLS